MAFFLFGFRNQMIGKFASLHPTNAMPGLRRAMSPFNTWSPHRLGLRCWRFWVIQLSYMWTVNVLRLWLHNQPIPYGYPAANLLLKDISVAVMLSVIQSFVVNNFRRTWSNCMNRWTWWVQGVGKRIWALCLSSPWLCEKYVVLRQGRSALV